ncbi:MAG: RNA polymerase sigma factor [Gemmatimonadetes bacterium]|nr:RNA polymerase sigma factor [Gemmatimonadota bacterium]NNF14073.1 RNA polymerase sigma factor [Gemmatimonadota bacterium]
MWCGPCWRLRLRVRRFQPDGLRCRPKQCTKGKRIETRGNLGQRVPEHFEQADVRRAADGDHAAFERLYREHVGRIHALCIRMTGDDVAEDLTQEVFIRAWNKLGTFKGDSKFGTWLHRLAINHVLSRRETLRRRQSHRAHGEGILNRLAAPVRRSSGHAMDLEKAIGELPERARDVFVLYDVEGYSHDEIAESLGVSVGTSKSQLHRARMLMRKHLD